MFFLGLISPDESLCHAISEQLKNAAGGWQQAQFATLEDALSAWSEALPPLIFWDAQDASATDEMASFFESRLTTTKPAPILLTLGDPPANIEAFGVAERFTRPLRLGYFLTRIQFYQSVIQQTPETSFALGSWVFMPRGRLLQQEGGEPVKLTDKEAALLEYLCAATSFVPRDELLAAIWGYNETVDTHTLETHIYRLRRKLMAAAPQGEDVFVSEQGGYLINPTWRSA